MADKYFIDIAAGKHTGVSSVHKFGAVPQMSISATGTIWDVDDTLYPWSAFSSADVVNIERNHVDDEGLQIKVEGLDANYASTSDTITISGTDTVGTVEFIRVFRAFVVNGSNTGNIDIEYAAAGGTLVARIQAGLGQTLMAIYTIPAGFTGYITQGTASIEAGGDATGNMFVRYFGSTGFRVGHSFEVSAVGGQYFYPFTTPVQIPEKSDIDVRATCRSNNSRITAAFDIILYENP